MSIFGKICRVIIHTADVERTFSQRIVVEGPNVEEYPIAEAVPLWAQKNMRRLLST